MARLLVDESIDTPYVQRYVGAERLEPRDSRRSSSVNDIEQTRTESKASICEKLRDPSLGGKMEVETEVDVRASVK